MSRNALLFGIPIEQPEYLARVDQSDYLRQYRRHPEQRWNDTYGPRVAAPCRTLAQKVKAIPHWHVQKKATLADLKRASQTAQTIVLVSHWKNYEWSNDDLIIPVEASRFAHAAATQANHPLAQWLAQAFTQHTMGDEQPPIQGWRQWLNDLQSFDPVERTVRDILEEALDILLENEVPAPEGTTEYIEFDLTRRTRRRNVMDSMFSNLVRPGNRLELFDGLHDCATVSRAIAQSFQGVLDLTTCTSTVLADHIGKEHQYCFRVVQFRQNQHPVVATAGIMATIQLFSAGYEYLDARQKAMQLVQEEAQRRIRATMESNQ